MIKLEYGSSSDEAEMEEVEEEHSPEAGPSGTRQGETKPAPAAAEENDGDGDGDDAAWRQTRAGKRILELKDVDESIGQLLHLAGCTLASLHPEPLSTFTSKIVSFEDGSEDGTATEVPKEGEEDKEKQFSQYAEAYYATLNDIQLALKNSIRHLRLSRASPAPLLDPFFGSLATPGGGGCLVGGVAMGESLKPITQGDNKSEESKDDVKGPKMSVAALLLEKEAWQDLAAALGKN